MSRTYRKQPIWFCNSCNKPHWKGKKVEGFNSSCKCDTYHGGYYKEVNVADNKLWDKPPKWFKQMRRRQQRAQEKQELRKFLRNNDNESIMNHWNSDFVPPVITKKSDQWNWT